jgi:hypothetical protein
MDDVSTIVNTVQNQRVHDNATQATRQTRTAAQISVDNASQAMSRHWHVRAFRTICHNVTPNRQIISLFKHQRNLNNG